MTTLVLASGSPRRRDLLSLLGLPFEVVPADVDETPLVGEGAEALVRRLAVAKARAGSALVPPPRHGALVVLAADTVVVVDDDILGKPRDPADARRMLALLAGRTHRVLTGVAVAVRRAGAPAAEARILAEVVATDVTMVTMSADQVDWYVATGEPLDKAGAYGIQGRGGLFVAGIVGSYDNVVGLPLVATRRLLATVGVDPFTARR